MGEWLAWWLDSNNYMPHGHCYLWQPRVLWLNVGSDVAIAASYFVIPAIIGYFVRHRRHEIRHGFVPLLFAAFIFLCGLTHLFDVWTVWNPDYRLGGLVKFVTAVASVGTAIALLFVMPSVMSLATPRQLEEQVALRTQELELANARLRREIDVRAGTDAALAASEERLRLATRALAGYIYEIDRERGTVWVSEGVERLTGYGPTDLPSHEDSWITLVHPEDQERARECWAEGRRNRRRQVNCEYRVRHRDGREVWLWDHAMFVYGDDGRARRIVGNVLDVTARREAERAVAEADRRKDEFLATLAHELRNPLAPLRTSLALLEQPRLAEELQAQVRATMKRQLAYLVRLVDDLLDVSRITRGRIQLHLAAVPLAEVLAQAREAVALDAEARRIDLGVELPEAGVVVRGDAVRLVQVFTNLLGNAVKYTDPGGSVRVGVRASDSAAVVAVQDTGVGIAREELGRVFEMFARVERPDRAAPPGLGVGLAIARRLVELQRGTIRADSAGPGRGAEFTVTLPLWAGTTGEGARAEPSGRAEPDVHAERSPPESRRVLVVDDNLDAADSLATLLASAGHEVRRAADGLEAIAVAADFRPQVIFMDLGMPRLDGLAATRRLRETDWGREAYVVVLTGWAQESDRLRSREAGADVHCAKPIDPEEALRLVRAPRAAHPRAQ